MTLNRNRAVARFMSFVIVATMVIGLFASAVTQVFADAQGTYTDADGSVYSYVWTDTNADNYYESTDGLTVMDATGNPVTVPAIVNAIKQSLPQKPSSVQTTDQVIDEITDTLHTHADIGAASRSLEGLTEIVNTVIGVLAIAILTLVGIFTAIDVLYLEVPPLHNSLDNGAMDKGQTNKSGGVKPKIISEDASQAYSEAMENGKNPLIIYLKKRVVAYIAVAIVLYMLLSGNLALIVKIVLKALNGVFGWAEEYAQS